MFELFHSLTNLLFIGIPFYLYIYTNRSSSKAFCLFPGGVYISFGVSNEFSVSNSIYFVLHGPGFEILRDPVPKILSSISLPIKSLVASPLF